MEIRLAMKNRRSGKILKTSWLESPLGPMLAIADEKALYLLEFIERKGLEKEIERLNKKMKLEIIPGNTQPIDNIKKELEQYFLGKLKAFKTPLFVMGTPFQQKVWKELKKIPLGTTCAYADIAIKIGKPTAYRAVANANGANQLAIIIPCHRVINSNNQLGGYGGGVSRKKWLIEHEQRFKK